MPICDDEEYNTSAGILARPQLGPHHLRNQPELDQLATVAFAEVVVPDGPGKLDVADQDFVFALKAAVEADFGDVRDPDMFVALGVGLLEDARQRLDLVGEGRLGVVLPEDAAESL